MKHILKISTVIVAFAVLALLSSSKVNDLYDTIAEITEQEVAGKLAFANSALILSELAEVKAAEAELKTLEDQLKAKGQNEVQTWQTKYQDLARKEQNGELSPKQIEEEAKKLDEEQKRISQLEQQMGQQLQDKRAALLQPILDNVNTAIADVAKEEGYLFVFDVTGGLLYADEGADITEKVKARL